MLDIDIDTDDEIPYTYVAPEAYQDDWDELDYIPGLEKAMKRSPESFQRIRKTASAEN